MRFLHRLASWRQHPDDRLAQDSFLNDVASQWKPQTAAERWLERQARAWHLVARLFDGRGTLAPVAVSLVPSVFAVVVLGLAGRPNRPEYAEVPSQLAYLLFTLGAIGLACEAVASPHAVRPVRWSLFAGPFAIGSLLAAVSTGRDLVADRIMLAGFVVFAVGMFMLVALPVVRDRRLQARWLRVGMVVSGVGLLLTVAGDLYWTALFRADGDDVWALGTGLASIGAWLFGTALIRSRAGIAVPSRS